VRRRARYGALLVGLLILTPLIAVGASLVHTELLRASFERQFWTDAAYPTAQLLGTWHAGGRVVAEGGAHCDFAAQAVYGTSDEYEPVEEHYAGRTVNVGSAAPLAFDVQPVSDRALTATPPRTNDPDLATRDVLLRTHTDVARAQSFHTVYVVQAVSWGHPAWLDWRCH
jgi:hypothetical protein